FARLRSRRGHRAVRPRGGADYPVRVLGQPGARSLKGREAAMPQLNPLDWAPQIIWLIITFGILYLLMVKVALPRIGGVIYALAANIAKDLAEADKLRRETEEAITAYEQALAEAKQKAHAIIESGRTKLKEEMAAERGRLEQDLAKKSAKAEQRIN